MTVSLALLAVPHIQAVQQMIAEVVKDGVDPAYLYPGTSTLQPNGQGTVPVYIDSDAYNDAQWPYRGSTQLTYTRIDLGAALGHLQLSFKVGPSYSATELVTKLSQILQLHFEPEDYIAESRELLTPSTTYLLKASADSVRWTGQVAIHLHR